MKREVYCHYARNWIPLGCARTRCPRCGAVLGTSHPVRDTPSPILKGNSEKLDIPNESLAKILKNAAPLGQHFWFPRPRTYREPRDHTVALSRLFQTPFHRHENPSDARNFNPDFQETSRSRKPREPHARPSSNTGTSASLRPSPPLRRSADNRRLCPPKTPRLRSKARPDIITVIIRPRLFRPNQTCSHVTETTIDQTEKEGRHRCHAHGDIPPFYAHDFALKAPSRTVRQHWARPRPPALNRHLSRTFEIPLPSQRTSPISSRLPRCCQASVPLFAPRTSCTSLSDRERTI